MNLTDPMHAMSACLSVRLSVCLSVCLLEHEVLLIDRQVHLRLGTSQPTARHAI